MDCSLPGSSIHGIFQARVLEWVAIAFSETLVLGTNKLNILQMRALQQSWVALGMTDGEGDGTPLQYSCLKNPMDRGAW